MSWVSFRHPEQQATRAWLTVVRCFSIATVSWSTRCSALIMELVWRSCGPPEGSVLTSPRKRKWLCLNMMRESKVFSATTNAIQSWCPTGDSQRHRKMLAWSNCVLRSLIEPFHARSSRKVSRMTHQDQESIGRLHARQCARNRRCWHDGWDRQRRATQFTRTSSAASQSGETEPSSGAEPWRCGVTARRGVSVAESGVSCAASDAAATSYMSIGVLR